MVNGLSDKMKKSELQQIIREEISKSLNEINAAKLEMFDRMDGLANIQDMKMFNTKLKALVNDWYDEGFEIKDIKVHRLSTTFRNVGQGELSSPWNLDISCPVLITKCMAANHDRLSPVWNKTWNVADDDWFAEDNAAENVTDSSVGRLPHLL